MQHSTHAYSQTDGDEQSSLMDSHITHTHTHTDSVCERGAAESL